MGIRDAVAEQQFLVRREGPKDRISPRLRLNAPIHRPSPRQGITFLDKLAEGNFE